MKRNDSCPKYTKNIQNEVNITNYSEKANSLFSEFKSLMIIIEAKIHNSKKSVEESSRKIKAYEILNSNNLFPENFNSDKFYSKIYLKLENLQRSLLDIIESFKSKQSDHFKIYSLQNKYNEIYHKYIKEVELNKSLINKNESQINAMNQMRTNYYKDIIYIKEKEKRRIAPSKYSSLIDVHYFSQLEGLDNSTIELLNNRLDEMKSIFEYNMEILSDRIQDLENRNKALIIENNKYKNLDLDNINILMDRLKEARKSPEKVWKSINQIFGPEFIKFFILQDIVNFEHLTESINKEFKLMEERTIKQIKEIENLFKVLNYSSKNIENQNNKKNNLNTDSDIELLQKNICILNSIIDQKNFIIEGLQKEVSKDNPFNNAFKNDIFNLLIDKFRCNYLTKFNNEGLILFKKISQNSKDSKVQCNEEDFYNYLISYNFLKDTSTDTHQLDEELNPKNKGISNSQEEQSLNNERKKKRKSRLKNKNYSFIRYNKLNKLEQSRNINYKDLTEIDNNSPFEISNIKKLNSNGKLNLNFTDFSKVIDSSQKIPLFFENQHKNFINHAASSIYQYKTNGKSNKEIFLENKKSFAKEVQQISEKNKWKEKEYTSRDK